MCQLLVLIAVGEEYLALSAVLGDKIAIGVVRVGGGQHFRHLAHELTGCQLSLGNGTHVFQVIFQFQIRTVVPVEGNGDITISLLHLLAT